MKGEELERIAMKDLVISAEMEYKFRREKRECCCWTAGLSGFE
jgi:hypothetical protein